MSKQDSKRSISKMYSILDDMMKIIDTEEVDENFSQELSACEFHLLELKSSMSEVGYSSFIGNEEDDYLVISDFDSDISIDGRVF